MQQFVKTCGSVYLIATTFLITIALITTLILITNPIVAAIGFAAIFACIILGSVSIRDRVQTFYTKQT